MIDAEEKSNQKTLGQSKLTSGRVDAGGVVYAAQEKIGTMIIGQGSLSWKGGKRQITKRISWSRFAAMMDELAYGKQ